MSSNQPIDRDHFSWFDYCAHTDSKDLLDAVKTIWLSLPSDTRAAIDPAGPNAKKAGLPTLEVVILQLFRLWITEPERCLATPRGNHLLVKSIYNPKGISPEKLRMVLDALEANGFTETIAHSHSDNPAHTNTTSRIRGSKQLFRLFEEIDASEFDITEDPNTPLVKLNKFDLDPRTGEPKKNKSGQKITKPEEFDLKLPHVVQMTEVLRAYNDLLRRTHISLANIDKPYIIRTNNKGETQNIKVTSASKTVRRVFSRNDWECYGRFTGGFWQRVGDKDTDETPYRRHIRINDEPTVELDYSSLHPNILTVEAGLDPIDDVYTLGHQVVEQYDQTQQRLILKGLMLNLLNAKNHKAAYGAFKYDQPTGHPFKSLKKEQFNKYVQAITTKHPHLEKSLGADQGVRLMFIDSQIIEQIIVLATTNNIPILTVHDSVICKERDEPNIRKFMRQASMKILGVELSFDVNRESVSKTIASKTFRDRDFTSRLFDFALTNSPTKATNYHNQQWERFQQHLTLQQ